MRSPRPACGCSATLLLSTSSRTSQDLFPCRKTTPHSQLKVLRRSGIRMIAEGRVEAEGFLSAHSHYSPLLSFFTLTRILILFDGKASHVRGPGGMYGKENANCFGRRNSGAGSGGRTGLARSGARRGSRRAESHDS